MALRARPRPIRMQRQRTLPRDMVALILAIGVATSLNFIVLAVFYDAVANSDSELSENATQVMTGVFGGLIGLLGSYMGFRAGQARDAQKEDKPPDKPPEEPGPP